MKSITNKLFAFAATALFLGTAAFGQTVSKAGIPFAFTIPGAGATAGNYVITVEGNSNKVVRLYNVDTHQSLAAMTFRAGGGPADDNSPRLIFRCNQAGCALSEIWTPNGGYAVPRGRAHAGEYLASIPLTTNRGN